TKASFAVREENVPAAFRDAFALASYEPPGPVHLDLPEDVLVAAAGRAPARGAPIGNKADGPHVGVVPDVERALAGSKRPLLAIGLSATRLPFSCRDQLLAFVEAQGIPFVTTLHAKGFLPES